MNEEEARTIYRQLFVAFPHFHDYVDAVDNPPETLRLWRLMLIRVDVASAEIAVRMMLAGDLVAPEKPWEIARLPHIIRDAAASIRDRRIRAERQAAVARQAEGLDQAIERRTARPSNFLARYDLCQMANTLLAQGKLTESEHREVRLHLDLQGRDDHAAIVIPPGLRPHPWQQLVKRWRCAVAPDEVSGLPLSESTP